MRLTFKDNVSLTSQYHCTHTHTLHIDIHSNLDLKYTEGILTLLPL